MAIRTTDEIIQSLLADEGVLHPAPASDDDVFAPLAPRGRRASNPPADRTALAAALRAVLDFEE